MSSVYAQEPPTSGKVILKTSMGDIDIELWTAEAPKACRNFIQLCLEGYYDNTIFHRLIPKFMIQGGDPTGTGAGGESIYGEPFKDEFHQRLKFTHRGLVAMANENKLNSNQSQFFMTFDACEWLYKKHTIFGKITGDSIYNFMQLQELETDSKDRPINPPSILKTNVVLNPFNDIVVRSDIQVKHSKVIQNLGQEKNLEQQNQSDDESSSSDEEEKRFKIENEKKKKELLLLKQKQELEKKKNLKNKNLLSFADDDEDEDNGDDDENDDEDDNKVEEIVVKKDNFKKPQNKKQILNIHDVAEDDRFSKETAIDIESLQKKKEKQEQEDDKKKRLQDRIKAAGASGKGKYEDEEIGNDDNENLKEGLTKKVFKENEVIEVSGKLAEENKDLLNYKKRFNKKTGQMEIYWENEGDQQKEDSDNNQSYSSTDSDEYDEEQKKQRQKQKEEYENLKISFLSSKKDGLGTNSLDQRKMKQDNNKLLTSLEKRKQKYLEKEQSKKHEGSYLQKLEQFRNKIKETGNKNSWVKHELKFQVTGDRAFQDFDAKEKVREYNIDEDTKKKGYVNKAIDNLKRGIEQHQDDINKRVSSDKLTVDDLMKLAEN